MAQLDLTFEEVEQAAATLARWWVRAHWSEATPDIPTILNLAPQLDDEHPPLVTPTEAARILRCSTRKVARLRERGQITPIKKLLPQVRYKRADIEKLIDKKR